MHLAQINISRLLAPIDDPLIADFKAALDPINALAESSPGFIWRLKTDGGNATDIQAFDDNLIIVNMSVWESVESLRAFAFQSAHTALYETAQRVVLKIPDQSDRLVVDSGGPHTYRRRSQRTAGPP